MLGLLKEQLKIALRVVYITPSFILAVLELLVGPRRELAKRIKFRLDGHFLTEGVERLLIRRCLFRDKHYMICLRHFLSREDRQVFTAHAHAEGRIGVGCELNLGLC